MADNPNVKVFSNSGHVDEGTFYPQEGRIRILFNSGAIYDYADCSAEDWEMIRDAESTGKAINDVLKIGGKPYKKVVQL